MNQRTIFVIAAWLALVTASLATSGCSRGSQANDATQKAAPERVSQTSAGDPLLRLEPASQTRIGLRTQVLTPQTIQPEIVAYGRLEEDPSRSFILRAPSAGILHFALGRDWPSIGQHLADNDLVGMMEPRLVPAERIALTNQLATARSEFSASTASVAAARSAYERARILNADNKNVSDRVVEDATARLNAEEARLKTATDTIQLLENSLQSAGPTGNRPLTVERGGDVVEIMAQPGESIEQGSPILRIARLDRLLARVDVPVGQHIPATFSRARIFAVGYENTPIPGENIALAATVDPKSQGESFLFRLTRTMFGLRPGLAVTARISVPGPRAKGVVIPSSAIVRVAGNSYAYVQIGSDQFVRKQVPLENPVEGGYFTATKLLAADRVVVEGAQLLLSEEFKPQTAHEED
jgi:hypothetical protein